MTDQPLLFDPPPPELTERQQFGLDELRRNPEGVHADEVGAAWHAATGKHDPGVRCDWCGRDGRGLLVELKRKGYARLRKGGIWQAVDETAPTVEKEVDWMGFGEPQEGGT